jgi:hypothetical protein
MNPPLSLWRRLWASLPLSYKLVMFGLSTVMSATLAVLIVTYASAGDSLKLQLERQLSRDLNVFEAWYKTRLEELQLSSAGLARHAEIAQALTGRTLAPAAPLLANETHRLQTDVAYLVDRDGQLLGPDGPVGRFDPDGVVSAALSRREPLAATENWTGGDLAALPPAQRHEGLVRLVVTPDRTGGPPARCCWATGSAPARPCPPRSRP